MARPRATAVYDWQVILAGTGSARTPHTRAQPATVVKTNELQFLVDCGDGTARQLTRQGVGLRWDAILLTAARGEQMSGLLTLATQLSRFNRRDVLDVYGPPGTEDALSALLTLSPDLAGYFRAWEPADGEFFVDKPGMHIEAIRLGGDPIARFAYSFFEGALPGRVDAAKAEQLGITGPEFSALQRGESVRKVRPRDVIGPPRRGRHVVVSGHTRPCDGLKEALDGADVAVLPAPYLDERLEVAEASLTMTGWEAAQIAAESHVRLLLLHQLSGATDVFAQRAEARQFHRNVFVPNDGDVAEVPVPDRGAPRFQPVGRHDGRQQRPRPAVQQRRQA